MLACQILALLGSATYPVALTSIQADWNLSNFQSGLIASAFFFGYVLTVPFATTLTDRIDAKKIYVLGGLLSASGLLGFGFFADNYVQACLCMAINGSGFAAIYMPGLKIISDRLDASELSRPIAFYTAFFGVGTGCSYLISGLMLPLIGWQMVFAGIALGPLAATLIVFTNVHPLKGLQQKHQFKLSDVLPIHQWKKVLLNKEAIQYILGYGLHCLELFASRNWIVAYLVYCGTHGQGELLISIPVLAGLINFIGVPSSILGNEMAARIGRQRWIYFVMIVSFFAALFLSTVSAQGWWIILGLAVIHMIFIMADSSTLTAGLVLSASSEIKGAAMGLHSLVGFIGGLTGPALFGFCLDQTKHLEATSPWTFAYLSIVLPSLLYVVVGLLKHQRKSIH